jgi:RHS repeat-associated protein
MDLHVRLRTRHDLSVDSSGNATYRSRTARFDGRPVQQQRYRDRHLTYDVRRRITPRASTEFTFTGEQNDPNGLEYLRARYYDSATGRFLGRDPLGGICMRRNQRTWWTRRPTKFVEPRSTDHFHASIQREFGLLEAC